MERGWFGVPFLIYAAVCLALAVVWVFVWPIDKAVGAVDLRFFLVRLGHSLVWALLGLMCLLKSGFTPALADPAKLVGLAALPVYLGFVAASFVAR
jgi:hypothetical protein